MTNFETLLRELVSHDVSFIVIGGVAGLVHGSARVTYDLDVVYDRSRENLDRVVAALAGLKPYLRGAPPGLPFIWDRKTLERGMNFTFVTSLGEIDLLGEMTGGGSYTDLAPHATEVELYGSKCLCLTLNQLIRAKRAAGRPKDFEALAELEAIREEQS